MKVFTLIIIALMLTGCQLIFEEGHGHLLTFDYANHNIVSGISLSELSVVEIEYIPLETCNESLLRRIDMIKISNGFFFFQNSNNVLKFNSDGLFIPKIGNQGRGPDEYSSIHDFGIKETTGNPCAGVFKEITELLDNTDQVKINIVLSISPDENSQKLAGYVCKLYETEGKEKRLNLSLGGTPAQKMRKARA